MSLYFWVCEYVSAWVLLRKKKEYVCVYLCVLKHEGVCVRTFVCAAHVFVCIWFVCEILYAMLCSHMQIIFVCFKCCLNANDWTKKYMNKNLCICWCEPKNKWKETCTLSNKTDHWCVTFHSIILYNIVY